MKTRIHNVFPADLINISPFPGHCVWKPGRFRNLNSAIVRNGKVDPDHIQYGKEYLSGIEQTNPVFYTLG